MLPEQVFYINPYRSRAALTGRRRLEGWPIKKRNRAEFCYIPSLPLSHFTRGL